MYQYYLRTLSTLAISLSVVCLLLSATGCRTFIEPIRTAQYLTGALGEANMEQMRLAINQSLAQIGWKVVQDNPWEIVAEVAVREETATVRISYSTKSFAIEHVKSSPGLGFDGYNIHKLYNNWINNLSRTIQGHLVPLMQKPLAPEPTSQPPDPPSEEPSEVPPDVPSEAPSDVPSEEPAATPEQD